VVVRAKHNFTDEEQDIASSHSQQLRRVVPIAALTPDAFAHALAEIEPLQENPLDALAAKLKERLPELLGDSD
jgi:hypothetical protein